MGGEQRWHRLLPAGVVEKWQQDVPPVSFQTQICGAKCHLGGGATSEISLDDLVTEQKTGLKYSVLIENLRYDKASRSGGDGH